MSSLPSFRPRGSIGITRGGQQISASQEILQYLDQLRQRIRELENVDKRINIAQQQVPNTSTEIYEARGETWIDRATVLNTTGGAVTLQVWIAMDGGAAADDNKIYDALSVAANTGASLDLLDGQALPNGAKIYMQASAATSLSITISGRKKLT